MGLRDFFVRPTAAVTSIHDKLLRLPRKRQQFSCGSATRSCELIPQRLDRSFSRGSRLSDVPEDRLQDWAVEGDLDALLPDIAEEPSHPRPRTMGMRSMHADPACFTHTLTQLVLNVHTAVIRKEYVVHLTRVFPHMCIQTCFQAISTAAEAQRGKHLPPVRAVNKS